MRQDIVCEFAAGGVFELSHEHARHSPQIFFGTLIKNFLLRAALAVCCLPDPFGTVERIDIKVVGRRVEVFLQIQLPWCWSFTASNRCSPAFHRGRYFSRSVVLTSCKNGGGSLPSILHHHEIDARNFWICMINDREYFSFKSITESVRSTVPVLSRIMKRITLLRLVLYKYFAVPFFPVTVSIIGQYGEHPRPLFGATTFNGETSNTLKT